MQPRVAQNFSNRFPNFLFHAHLYLGRQKKFLKIMYSEITIAAKNHFKAVILNIIMLGIN